MKRVIVSGATSMIGVALIESCLRQNCRVVALVRSDSAKVERLPKDDRIQLISCSLENLQTLSAEQIGSCDVFYHFGWANTNKAGRLSPELQQKNIAYTLAAVELAARLGCGRFVGAGSQAEYGIHQDCPTTPASPVMPQIAYGICKYAAGKLGRMRAEQLGMDFTWVRIFSIYGPFDLPDTMVSASLKKMLAGEHCSFSPGTHLWDYLYSSDAGEAFRLIGEKCVGSQVYCLGSGSARQLKEYIETMRDLAAPGLELGLGEIPYPDGKSMDMQADISALCADTGWMPLVDFQTGIDRILKFWREK